MRAAIISLAALLPLAACGAPETAGGEAKRAFPATGFDRITLAGPDDVAIAIGPAFAVVADGDQAVIDRLDVSVRDGELRVGRQGSTRSGWFSWMRQQRGAKVRVTLPMLRGVTVSGVGSASVAGAKAPVFIGAVEGAGNLDIRGLEAGNAAFKLSGAGSIDVEGTAGDVTMDVTGAGNVSAAKLAARDIDVSVSGVGNVDARATGRANLRVSGVGNVDVKGTENCQVSRSGVGNVSCGK